MNNDELSPIHLDAYRPAEIARRVEQFGVSKTQEPLTKILALSVMAGAFISYGAMLFTLVISDSQLGAGPTQWLGGMAFSLGLILIVVGGAELFTGNNLIVMAWASRKITTQEVLTNWVIVFFGNLIGALATAFLVAASGVLGAPDTTLAGTAITMAENKVTMDFGQLFIRGLLCNVMVCLAVWLSMAAHTVAGKIIAIIFPISAFVALGFEHSIANMYIIPLGIFLGSELVTWKGVFANLLPVMLGNLFGGAGLVALVYWACYLKE